MQILFVHPNFPAQFGPVARRLAQRDDIDCVFLSKNARGVHDGIRCLPFQPRLIVLDEPNANLDAEGEEALLKAMKGLKESRVTQIIISHKPALLAHVDKILVLRDGQVALFGPTREVLARIGRSNSQIVTPIHPITAEKEAQHG